MVKFDLKPETIGMTYSFEQNGKLMYIQVLKYHDRNNEQNIEVKYGEQKKI